MNVRCGGCQGKGAHRRYCPAVVGRHAAMRGRWSQRCEDLADEIGANDPGAANRLYQLAGQFRTEAMTFAEAFDGLRRDGKDFAAVETVEVQEREGTRSV